MNKQRISSALIGCFIHGIGHDSFADFFDFLLRLLVAAAEVGVIHLDGQIAITTGTGNAVDHQQEDITGRWSFCLNVFFKFLYDLFYKNV